MKEYVAKFHAVCVANGAKTALYSTWARKDAPGRQIEITSGYNAAAAAIDAIVVPVGEAWANVSKNHPEIVLDDRDGSHPSKVGTCLAACMFLKKRFGRKLIGEQIERIPIAVASMLQNAEEVACKES